MARTEFDLTGLHRAVAAAVPDRECIVHGARRLSYADVAERSRRVASLLHAAGLGIHRPRASLANHESGQDHVALYLHNGTEYLEAMLGSFGARAIPFNVNYRYVTHELRYLLADAAPAAIVFHEAFAPTLAEVLPGLGGVELLVQVADGSGHSLLPGAVAYEAALANAEPAGPPVEPAPDDGYLLYTGGTTGMPKGVLWRQHDIFVACMGGRRRGRPPFASLEQVVERAVNGRRARWMPLPPFMHGTGQWAAFLAMHGGGTVVLPPDTGRLDADAAWSTVEREEVTILVGVGNAMARPLVEAFERAPVDATSLAFYSNGGAGLSPELKARMLEVLPDLTVLDSVGSSETGAQLSQAQGRGSTSPTSFTPSPSTVVLSADRAGLVAPGHEGTGWLAEAGTVPLGYLGDAGGTRETFPVLDGVRHAVPGDRARLLADGTVELLGRDSMTINSGGEKVFAEEVERTALAHPDVTDAVVVGRASDRWGQEVVAVVSLAVGGDVDDVAAFVGDRLARYKVPKAYVVVEQVERSPAGKADYRWAARVAAAASEGAA